MDSFFIKTLSLCGLLFMLLTGCVAKDKGISVNPDETIIFLGDSITREGIKPNGYIALTKQAIVDAYPQKEIEIIGSGKSGNRVPDILERLQTDVIDKGATTVVIYIGINDVWHWEENKGTPVAEFEAGLTSIVTQILASGAKVVLCTPTVIGEKIDGSNKYDLMLEQYSSISRSVAKQFGIKLLDLRLSFMDYLKQHNQSNLPKGVVSLDGVHLNDAGNQLLSQLVLKALNIPSSENVKVTQRYVSTADYQQVYLYNTQQTGRLANLARWYSYIQSQKKCTLGKGYETNRISPRGCFSWLLDASSTLGEGWFQSVSPWWVNPSHEVTDSQIKLINVIAASQLPLADKSQVDMTDATLTFTVRKDGLKMVKSESIEGALDSHIYFWFQTKTHPKPNCTIDLKMGESCIRNSDYILVGDGSAKYQIDHIPDGQAVDFHFNLSPTVGWTCLGSANDLLFDCIDIKEALKDVAVVGFISGPDRSCPLTQGGLCQACPLGPNGDCINDSNSEKYYNVGSIAFKDVKISAALKINSVRENIKFLPAITSGEPPASGWTHIVYGAAHHYGFGDGVLIDIDQDPGYIRVGLAQNNTHTEFSNIGQHLYLSRENELHGTIYFLDEASKINSIGRYSIGDKLLIVNSLQGIRVLKNDEIIYQNESGCKLQSECLLYPFMSKLGAWEIPSIVRVFDQ